MFVGKDQIIKLAVEKLGKPCVLVNLERVYIQDVPVVNEFLRELEEIGVSIESWYGILVLEDEAQLQRVVEIASSEIYEARGISVEPVTI